MSDNPSVSVIIPARDAPDILPMALKSIELQTYSNIVEVIVAAADPETAAAAQDATVIMNPSGSTPVGLNLALEKATGEIVVRCDAQARLSADYVEIAVATMQRTGAANVGGMQVPAGTIPWERAIGAAMSSPLGAGNARYRIGGEEGPAETVYLGVFDRKALLEVGGFDESFARTQDYELNHRLVESGFVVWFDPSLRVEYMPRGSLSALADQYFKYGVAKRAFSKKHPGSLQWRQLAPPLIFLLLAFSVILSVLYPVVLVIPSVYVLVVLVGALPSWRKALALVTMHLSWGLGFLIGTTRH